MGPHRDFSQRLVAVFLLGCLLFAYPLLAVFNVAATVAGIPVLYLYVFAAWLLLIVLAARVVGRAPPAAAPPPDPER